MRKGALIKRKQLKNLVLFIIILVMVNVLFSKISFRLDLTKDSRFTLTQPTKKLLRSLDKTVRIKVYLKGKNFPADFRHLSSSAKDLLEEFRRYSNGHLEFEFVNPLAGVPDGEKQKVLDSLASMGIQPYNVKAQQEASEGVSIQLIFPAALIDYNGHEMGINLLQSQPGSSSEQAINHSTALMEYHFAHTIALLAQGALPKVAYLLGNGEALDPSVYDALTMMDHLYRFDTLNLQYAPAISNQYNAIVILDPSEAFTKSDKLKIDQYLMQGGKILWAVHGVRASMDSLQNQTSFLAFDRGLNLEDQLFTYGVRINGNILQDLQCFSIPVTVGHIGNQPQIQRLPWVYEPLLTPEQGNVITNNMDLVLSSFAGSIDTIKVPEIRKNILLATSTNSRSIATPARISLEDIKREPDPRSFTKKHIPVAVSLEGTFSSVFTNRLNATELGNIKIQSGKDFRSTSEPTKMIVVSDPNIFKNAISKKDGPLPMGMDSYTRTLFANRDFFENSLTWLTDTTDIMLARNKEFALRLMDKARVQNQKDKWKILGFLIPFAFIFLFGFVFQYIRKRRFS